MERLKPYLHLSWKLLGACLVLYSIIRGLTIEIPLLPIVEETVRNVFFHVCMWFAMIAVLLVSVVFSMRYLHTHDIKNDIWAVESVNVGLLFGILGIITGMIWAKFTWGAFWVRDPKLNGAAVSIIAYLAYMVLRASVDTKSLKAKLGAVYNIFAFVLLIIFVIILPRVADGSLHPGSGNDTPFAVAKLNSDMAMVFVPALIGWILMGIWIVQIRVKLRYLENHF